jgi:large conductance mechanosensitive channel
MSLASDFKAFALKGNVVDLAVGVIIGGAFGKIVAAMVEDLFMPVIGLVMPGGDWRSYTATPAHLKVGHLLGTVLDFVIVAFVLFITVVKLMETVNKRNATAAVVEAPKTKVCAECLETIPAAARRCRACTSVLAA